MELVRAVLAQPGVLLLGAHIVDADAGVEQTFALGLADPRQLGFEVHLDERGGQCGEQIHLVGGDEDGYGLILGFGA